MIGDSQDRLKFSLYMSDLHTLIGQQHADQVLDLWLDISDELINPPLPVASMGGELGFTFTWRSEELYLDIDISIKGEKEWYYKNKWTGEEVFKDNFDLVEFIERLREFRKVGEVENGAD